jgi:hypothetical protein
MGVYSWLIRHARRACIGLPSVLSWCETFLTHLNPPPALVQPNELHIMVRGGLLVPNLTTSTGRFTAGRSSPLHNTVVAYCHASGLAPRVAVSYGGVGGRANGCTPRAWARGRGTYSGCTRRARWASLCTSCEGGPISQGYTPVDVDRTAVHQGLHRELP